MSDYTQVNDYSAKDALSSGDPSKKILGSDIDAELAAIAAAITSKGDKAGGTLSDPTFTGTVTTPTPAIGSDTTVAASTAFVRDILPAGVIVPYGGGAAPSGWLLCDGSAVSRTTYSALFTAISTTFGAGDGSTTFNVPDLQGRSALGAGNGTLAENTAAADVDTTNDTFLVASNTDTWLTGMAVVLTTTGTLPTGLSLATTYYVVRSDATHIKFASSLANAVAGTVIDITAIGSGTHTTTSTLTTRTLGRKLGEETHANTVSETPAHNHGGSTSSDGNHTHTYSSGASGAPNPIGLTNMDTFGGAQNSSSAGAHTHTISSQGGSAAHNNMGPSLVLNYIIKT